MQIPRFSGEPMKQVIEGGQFSHMEFTSGPPCSFSDALKKTEAKFSFAEGNIFDKASFQNVIDAGGIKYEIAADLGDVVCFSEVKFRPDITEPQATFEDGKKFIQQLSKKVVELKPTISDKATIVIVLNPFDADNQELFNGISSAYNLDNPLLVLYWHFSGEN